MKVLKGPEANAGETTALTAAGLETPQGQPQRGLAPQAAGTGRHVRSILHKTQPKPVIHLEAPQAEAEAEGPLSSHLGATTAPRRAQPPVRPCSGPGLRASACTGAAFHVPGHPAARRSVRHLNLPPGAQRAPRAGEAGEAVRAPTYLSSRPRGSGEASRAARASSRGPPLPRRPAGAPSSSRRAAATATAARGRCSPEPPCPARRPRAPASPAGAPAAPPGRAG